MSVDLGEVTVDQLTIGWTITQRKKGHRHSTDDLLTGWYAAEKKPTALRLLDLGAGIGSVGLLALWRAPSDATLVSIEAQEISFVLLERNIADNSLGDRARAIHGDLRELENWGRAPVSGVRYSDTAEEIARTAEEMARSYVAGVRHSAVFDLVTGSPPYWDVSEGVLPDDPQKQAARFELRGTVADYARAARAALAPDARFVFCFPTVQTERARAACIAHDLVVESERDVIPREGAAPLFTLYCARRREDIGDTGVIEAPHIVRDANGDPTAMHAAARATFGFASSPR